MLINRVPPWFREDPLVNTVGRQTEETKLRTYYDRLSVYPKQPAKLWPIFDQKIYSFTGQVWNGNNSTNCSLSGSYPLNYNFTIETEDLELVAPIDINTSNATIRIRENLPANSNIYIDPSKIIRIDNNELFSIDNESQENYGALIDLGKSESNNSLKQEFIITEHGLREIDLMFGPTIGNPEDNIVISLYLDEEIIATKEIPIDVIIQFEDLPLTIGFEEDLIAGKTYSILIERDGDIDYDSYYTMRGSLSLYPNGTLYGYNDEEWHIVTAQEEIDEEIEEGEASLYFVTKVRPLLFVRNLGNVEDFTSYNFDITREEPFSELELVFGDTIGNPTTTLVFDLTMNGELLERQYLESSDIISSIGEFFTISLTERYVEGDYSISIYTNNYLYDEDNFYTLVTFEDLYPSVFPPLDKVNLYCIDCPAGFNQEANAITLSGTTIGVELTSIYAQMFAYKMHPLKSIKIYIERENSSDMIEEAYFEKHLEQLCFFTEILSENIENPIEKLPFNIFAVIEYWGLRDKKTIGFPQGENEQYSINDNIDSIGALFGINRREYKEDIPYQDYPYTYPIGYPWETEQDYWYEKRILDEYATRADKVDKVTIYEHYQEDIGWIPLLELRTKSPDIHTVEINVGEKGLDCDDLCFDEVIQTISVTDTDIQGIVRTQETYLYEGDIIKLLDDINYNSTLLEATYLNSTQEALEVGTLFLNTEGTYQNYGLIKAEINQYLGVIPRIKDMVDYCLIWNEKFWDRYVWAGDQWDAGVFELEIPIQEIPKNFKLLTIEELQQIVGKCKAFGTHALPMYTTEQLLKTEFTTNFEHAEYIYETIPVEFEALLADMYESVIAQFMVEYLGVEGESSADIGLGFSLEFEVARLIEESIDLSKGIDEYTVSSGASVEISQSTYTNTKYPSRATSEGSGFAWNYASRITADDGNAAYSYGSAVGTSKKLVGFVYPTLPDGARVHGLIVNVNYANSSRYRSPYFNYQEHTLEVTNNDIWVKEQQTYTGGGGWYVATFGHKSGLAWEQGTLPHYTPSTYNQGVMLKYNCTIDSGDTAYVDTMKMVIYYKRGRGNYVSTNIATPELPEGYDEGYWDSITTTETTPSGNTLTYDVFRDIVDQSQTLSNSDYIFGESTVQMVYQNFKPTVSWLTGIWVKAGSTPVVGSPTGDIKVSIKKQGVDDILQYHTIEKELWTANAEIFVPFHLDLTVGSTYSILIGVTGSVSPTNYYKVAWRNSNVYANGGMGTYQTGIGYRALNGGEADLWFKTTRGDVLLSNKSSPIDISSLPFIDLRLEAKLTTDWAGVETPEITSITAHAKVINE